MEIVPGKIITEIRQYFYREEADEDYTYSVTTRVPQSFPRGRLCYRLEQSYSLGPLVVNTEAVLRTKTSLKNNRTLFTDDNGYQMMKRPSRTFVNDTVARNYYPMVRMAYIEDESSRLVLLSERAHGASSQSEGELEVMLHRRLWNNQEWTLSYNLTLNDSSVVRPVLWMTLGSLAATSSLYQREALELQHRPVVMPIDRSPIRPVVLPDNLHLLTLSVPGWVYNSNHTLHLRNIETGSTQPDYDRVLLRIMHLYEKGEDPVLSQPSTINMKEVLQGMGEVRALEERSLTGTWDIADLQRWKWKASEDPGRGVSRSSVGVRGEFNVTISPKEIRTFFVYFKLK
uniref:Glycosyl hydrolase family 38 C-terminal domain-containing protein n=1 Tax=Salmo trutta TaxID=8032 RepID=A0A674B161_SALTR